jgi:heat shock protein HslJ
VGAPPIAVSLDVPTPDPRASVTVRAAVRAGDTLLLTSDTVAPVLTGNAGNHADVTLVHVAARTAPALTGIDWRLTALGGATVPPEAREAILRFDAGMDGASFAASVGCNRFAGQVRIARDTLAFGPARSTRMACPPPLAAAEAALSAALTATAGWRIEGATLLLLDAAGTVLLEASAP